MFRLYKYLTNPIDWASLSSLHFDIVLDTQSGDAWRPVWPG